MGLLDRLRNRTNTSNQGLGQQNFIGVTEDDIARFRGMTEIGLKRANTEYLEELAKAYHVYSIMGRGDCAIWKRVCHMKDNYFVSTIDSQEKAEELQRKYGHNLNITQVVIGARYTSSQASFDHEIDSMVRVLRDFFIYAPVAKVAREKGFSI